MPAALVIVTELGKTHTNLLCEDKAVFTVVAPVDFLFIPWGGGKVSFVFNKTLLTMCYNINNPD